MHKYLIVTFLLAFVHINASGALPGSNSLRGVIKDNSGAPLQGVIIEIPDLKLGTISDSVGHYRIDNLPKGKFAVVVSLMSYAKTTKVVGIAGDTKQDFTLSESAIESHEVVITGQSKATEIKRSPVPVEVINNQYLKTNISTNIIDAIARVPGVSEVSTGPNVSKPVIRGLGSNRVLTLYNGMRQEGQQWGDEHGIEVDEYNVEKIELVKGPSSLIYGSDAMAGVVNLIPTKPAADGKTIGTFTSEYQSNNGMIGVSGVVTGNHKGIYWLGRLSHKMAKDYQNPVDGRVYATNFAETDVNGSAGINKSWGFAHVDVSLYDDVQAIPDGSRDSASRRFTKQVTEADTSRPIVGNDELNSYAIPVLHQHVQHYRVLSTNSFNIKDGSMVVNAGFERSVRREFSHPEYGNIAGLYLQLNTYTYDVKYHFRSLKGWDITTGLNGMYQSNNVSKGTDFIIPSYHQFDIGPFAVVERTIGKLSLSGGVRFDSRVFHNDALDTKTDPATGFDVFYSGNDTTGVSHPFQKYDHTFSGASYSIGGAYVFSKSVAVKANVARGFRAPGILEISANGVHPGTNIYQNGNQSFKPEFSLQEDIGMEFTSQHLSINVSVFNNDITNYIYNTKTGSSADIDTFQFVQGNANLYGGELSIDIHPHPLDWLHFENGISVVYGVNRGANGASVTDSAKYLPFIPPLHFTSELRADLGKPVKYVRNAFVKVQLLVYAKQDKVYLADNTETPTAGYTLVNMGFGADVVSRKGKVLFNIGVFGNNLFDVAYQDHLSRPKYFEPYPNDPRGRSGIYNTGRNVGLKLSIPLNLGHA